MNLIKVSTQDELDAALALPAPHEIWICGTGRFVLRQSAQHFVRATESSHVVAWGSSHVEAWGSSHVVAWGSSHVEAWGSSHVEARESSHVVAWGSSHVEARGSSHVEARESSHVVARESSHVEARGSSHVVARGAAFVRARDRSKTEVATGSTVVVMRHATTAIVENGSVVIDVPPVTTAQAWCDYYGVEVKDGVAIVYKAVRDSYCSSHGLLYAPGSAPTAPDWDGGKEECGGGLHFSPRPVAAKGFDPDATKFLACPVALVDMRAPAANDAYPSKIKARGCCGPVREVTLWGEPVEPSAEEAVSR
jgi:hypothetical protein